MIRPTLDTVRELVIRVGSISCPKTANKGAVGILCEQLAGIPQSSAHIDCSDGEVKVFPLKRLANGTLGPKETIAVTMLNTSKLESQPDFANSHVGTKMAKMLFIPYLRDGDSIQFYPPIDFSLEGLALENLKKDYDLIRNTYMDAGVLSSSVGAYIQTRTKGAGGDAPKTRAYYLRKEFIHTFLKPTW